MTYSILVITTWQWLSIFKQPDLFFHCVFTIYSLLLTFDCFVWQFRSKWNCIYTIWNPSIIIFTSKPLNLSLFIIEVKRPRSLCSALSVFFNMQNNDNIYIKRFMQTLIQFAPRSLFSFILTVCFTDRSLYFSLYYLVCVFSAAIDKVHINQWKQSNSIWERISWSTWKQRECAIERDRKIREDEGSQ